jgi:hypothetical protein
VARLESSFVKTDNVALAQDAAILGPIAEATNPTCKISPNIKTKKDYVHNSILQQITSIHCFI